MRLFFTAKKRVFSFTYHMPMKKYKPLFDQMIDFGQTGIDNVEPLIFYRLDP